MFRRNTSIIFARINRRPTPGAAPAAATAAATPTQTTPVQPEQQHQQQSAPTSASSNAEKKDNSVDWAKAGDMLRKNSGVLFAAANLYGFKTNVLSAGMNLFDDTKAKEEAEKKKKDEEEARKRKEEEEEERKWQKAWAQAEAMEKRDREEAAQAAKEKADAENKNWYDSLFKTKEQEKPKQDGNSLTVFFLTSVIFFGYLYYQVKSSFADARAKEQLKKELLEEAKKALREEEENKKNPKSKGWFSS